MCYEQYGRFLFVYLQNIIKLLRPTFNSIKNRPKLAYYLRTNVTNSQTFGGNSSNIDFVHILQLDKP